ncbi:MAG TPA: hypothetical protein VGJ35_12310 [Burkholderiaceae bacterium]|jgi:hypothetical protein
MRSIKPTITPEDSMRLPKPALHATYRAKDGIRYTVQEVADLPFVGEYFLVLASEHEMRNGTKPASITDVEFARFYAEHGLQRVTSVR